MTYFPILQAPDCKGVTTLSNFPPNSWEKCRKVDRLVHATWLENGVWHSEYLQSLAFGDFLSVGADDILPVDSKEKLILLSLSESPLPSTADTLPVINCPRTLVPSWRATLGLSYRDSIVSYQGEIEPFPDKASLLSFGSFLQQSPTIRNYLLLMNITKSGKSLENTLEFRTCESNNLLARVPIRTNAINIVDLDDIFKTGQGLPMISCQNMTGIPIYFSVDEKTGHMSLEHTHPPASMVIHGNRWKVQNMLKKNWFSK